MEREQENHMGEQWIRNHASSIGVHLEHRYPRTEGRFIPQNHVEDIAIALQGVIAEVIQAWIDAGSERDVTMENEELFRAIYDELKGWSDHPANIPA
jgi:hypothetical protein